MSSSKDESMDKEEDEEIQEVEVMQMIKKNRQEKGSGGNVAVAAG